MYGPGQPQRPMPPQGPPPPGRPQAPYPGGQGYAPDQGQGRPPGPPFQGGPQPATAAYPTTASPPHPPIASPPHPHSQQRQPTAPARGSRLFVLAVVALLVGVGTTNAITAVLGYLDGGNVGVLVVGGDPLFLAIAQATCGVAWVTFGLLLLTGRRGPWGAALASVGVFGVLEAYYIGSGAVVHFVGLFAAIAAGALLNLEAVRRHCKVGPPAR